jgi:hydrogenase expression/formation protein HypC
MCLALPCRIVELLPEEQAIIDVSGMRKQISLALVDGVSVNDYVIVHVGYALARLDADEADKTLALFAELGNAALEEAGAII